MADPSSTSSLVQELENILRAGRIAGCINLACFVVIYYDWITTLDLEVELVWKSNWSKLTVSYVSTRYLTLAYYFMILYYQFADNLSDSACTNLYNAILLIIGFVADCAALIWTVRTIAVWERGRWITYIAYTMYATVTIFVLVFSVLSLGHTTHTKPPEIAGSIGCTMTFETFHLTVIFIAGTVFDTANLVLLLVRGASLMWWGRESRLFRTIYGDGVLFFVYMCGMSIANVVFIFSSSNYKQVLVMYFQVITTIPGALCSLLACRVVLHLRMQRTGPPMIGMSLDATVQRSKMSAIEFRPA